MIAGVYEYVRSIVELIEVVGSCLTALLIDVVAKVLVGAIDDFVLASIVVILFSFVVVVIVGFCVIVGVVCTVVTLHLQLYDSIYIYIRLI